MSENHENIVPADLPAEKQKKIRNPFAKKENTPKKQPLHGVYAFGVLLLVGGAVVAIASKLGKDEDETSESTTEAA